MTVTTKYGNSATEVSRGSDYGAWFNESNANGNTGSEALGQIDYGNDPPPFGSGDFSVNWLRFGIDNFNFSGQSVSSVVIGCRIRYSNGVSSTLKYRLSVNNGSTWCSSEHTDVMGTSLTWETDTCTHHTFTNDNPDDMMIRIHADGSSTGTLNLWCAAVRVQITHVTAATVPGVPADPTVSQSNAAYVTLSSSSPSDGGASLDNVEHQISTSSSFASGNITWTKGSAPSNPEITDSPAIAVALNTFYYVRARYHNSVGWGGYNPSAYNTITTWDAPNLPTGLTSTSETTTSINLSWTAPSDNGGESIDEYHVYWRPTPEALPPLDSDLDVWYKFNGDFNDSSGNARHGTTNSNVTVNDVPVIGNNEEGANWNGANNSYVRTPNFAVSGDTVMYGGWMYHDGSGNQTVLGDNAQHNTIGFIWTYFIGLSLYAQYARAGSTRATASWSNILSGYTNQWVHIFIVQDFTAKTIKAYRNGSLVASVVMTGTPVFPSTTRFRYVGNYSTSHSYSYNGQYDDFMLYFGSTALSDAQVQEIYDRRFIEIDTNSASTTYNKTTLTVGKQYDFYVAAYNAVGRGDLSAVYTRYTDVTTPTAPVVTATDFNELTVDWSASVSTGIDQWDVEQDDDGLGSGWANIPNNPHASGSTSEVITGLTGGEDFFYRLRARNPNAEYTGYSGNGTATVYDFPDSQNVTSVSNSIADSLLRVSRNSSPPNDRGSALLSWEVWRATTEGGSYSLVEAGISMGTTIYDDWSVRGGETWYYKLIFVTAIGDSDISTTGIGNTALHASFELDSDARVKIYEQEIDLPSNSRVRRTYALSLLSNAKAVYLDQTISLLSNTAVQVYDQTIELDSDAWVILRNQSMSILSDAFVMYIDQSISLLSDTRVKRLGQSLSLTSDAESTVSRAAWQPSMTWDKYEFNGTPTDITANEIDITLDLPDEDKTTQAIHIDPFELTMVSPNTHEFFFTASSGTGTPEYKQNTLANGFFIYVSGSGYTQGTRARPIGMDTKPAWAGGNVTFLLDIEGDWGTSGAELFMSGNWSNTDTSWSPPSGSGTNVMDIPTSYNGAIMVVNDYSNWDGNIYRGFHQWNPVQIIVGHAVEVESFDFSSGTYSDNQIDFHGDVFTTYTAQFKIYHEFAQLWEWYSGATKINSGSITPTENTWKVITVDDFRWQGTPNTKDYTLKLFGNASGSQFDYDFGEPLREIFVTAHYT